MKLAGYISKDTWQILCGYNYWAKVLIWHLSFQCWSDASISYFPIYMPNLDGSESNFNKKKIPQPNLNLWSSTAVGSPYSDSTASWPCHLLPNEKPVANCFICMNTLRLTLPLQRDLTTQKYSRAYPPLATKRQVAIFVWIDNWHMQIAVFVWIGIGM